MAARSALFKNKELLKMDKRVGWWVVPSCVDDDGEKLKGFFLTDERAEKFHEEPGFNRYHLEPVYMVLANPVVNAIISERERCTEVLHQLTHRIAEYLYGHTREQALEWAKSDKYDSDAARAMDILDICKHAINGR